VNVQNRNQVEIEGQSDAGFTSWFFRRALLFVLVALFSFVSVGAFCETDEEKAGRRLLSPDESRAILERLGNMRKDIITLQAGFIEERTIPSIPTPLKFEGRIYYQNKKLFFMEYEKPFRHILRVRDNEALFFVEGSTTADLVNIGGVQGIAGNADIFAVDPARFSGQVLEGKGVYVLEENRIDNGEKEQGSRLSVYLDKKNLLVRKILMEDESGDATVISLFNIETNKEIPQKILSFHLPEEVKINRMNQQ